MTLLALKKAAPRFAHISSSIVAIAYCSPQHQHAGSLWTILKCFGFGDLPERLNGYGIHSLDNVMTLDPTIHDWFDRLEIWFEAVVSDFKFSSPLTLNMRRMAWKIPMLFGLSETIAFANASQTQ